MNNCLYRLTGNRSRFSILRAFYSRMTHQIRYLESSLGLKTDPCGWVYRANLLVLFISIGQVRDDNSLPENIFWLSGITTPPTNIREIGIQIVDDEFCWEIFKVGRVNILMWLGFYLSIYLSILLYYAGWSAIVVESLEKLLITLPNHLVCHL